mmetsp:Transcript_94765/g.295143  ORF Transcript_94765/g.295143 Transcript_94765/m.295143 type:complete len:285 (-) Transcript_94765:81-935(-)
MRGRAARASGLREPWTQLEQDTAAALSRAMAAVEVWSTTLRRWVDLESSNIALALADEGFGDGTVTPDSMRRQVSCRKHVPRGHGLLAAESLSSTGLGGSSSPSADSCALAGAESEEVQPLSPRPRQRVWGGPVDMPQVRQWDPVTGCWRVRSEVRRAAALGPAADPNASAAASFKRPAGHFKAAAPEEAFDPIRVYHEHVGRLMKQASPSPLLASCRLPAPNGPPASCSLPGACSPLGGGGLPAACIPPRIRSMPSRCSLPAASTARVRMSPLHIEASLRREL